ncbi:hypothetical protein [Streptomyces sp. AK02-04a]|uniref:acyl carrier protein n=1 Tax=Streptomyces sp. AK02-04a TaxID=3028649 RepID=UPI0029B61913|nr:hypothetical protein [Streptomyces sp. AK02-04a]MDX3763518.1 hypothetical protein [Streptomyces sp. AK02-04a]
MGETLALLFPGPRRRLPGSLADLPEDEPLVSETLARIHRDAAGVLHEPVTPPLLENVPASEEPATGAPPTPRPSTKVLSEQPQHGQKDEPEPTSACPADDGWLPGREGVAQLHELYARALDYPVEALTPTADVTADMGIDSTKQTGLVARALGRVGNKLPGSSGEHPATCPALAEAADLIISNPAAAAEPAESRS